jgi:hypothetical protein
MGLYFWNIFGPKYDRILGDFFANAVGKKYFEERRRNVRLGFLSNEILMYKFKYSINDWFKHSPTAYAPSQKKNGSAQ